MTGSLKNYHNARIDASFVLRVYRLMQKHPEGMSRRQIICEAMGLPLSRGGLGVYYDKVNAVLLVFRGLGLLGEKYDPSSGVRRYRIRAFKVED
jgi:hypothetical protein